MTKYETSSMLFTQALKTLLRSFWAEFACGSFLCGVPIFVWVHVYKYKVGCCNQNRVLICVSDYYQILWQNIYSPSRTPPSNQNRVLICVSDYYQILWQNIYSTSHTPPSNQNRVLICVSDYYQILWQNIYSTSHTPPSNTPTSTLSLPGEWSYSLVSGYAQAMLHCIANHLLDIIPSSYLYPLGC